MHNGLLQLGSDKMSKSLGNLVSVVEALERYSPDAIRLYFLSSHYRSPLAYSDEGAAAIERSLDRIRHALTPSDGSGPQVDPSSHCDRFTTAMDDDLNTPQAVAALFDLARDINRGRDAGQRVDDGQAALRELGSVLGLTFEERASSDTELAAAQFIDMLVSVRSDLRAARQFALADQIRDGLAAQGVSLEDGPQGTQWQYHSQG
jgi:cysteinyl-tRNA synthetase